MDCADLMQEDVFSVSDTDTVRRAAEVMAEGNVGFLPVCGSIRDVLGVITDRDIVTRVTAQGLSGETTVGDIMTRGAATCSRREKVTNALTRMREDCITRLICTDESGALVGVLSLDDIARHEQFRHALAATEKDVAIARS